MQHTIKGILNAVVVIILVVWLLKVFGELVAGFNDYIAKPMNKKLLLEKIMQFNQAHLIQ